MTISTCHTVISRQEYGNIQYCIEALNVHRIGTPHPDPLSPRYMSFDLLGRSYYQIKFPAKGANVGL